MKLGFTTLALFMEPTQDIINLAKKHEFEIIEKINNDSGYYTEISSDLFSEKYYIQLFKDGEIINFIFDLKILKS